MTLKHALAFLFILLVLGCQEERVSPVKEPNPLNKFLTSFLIEAEKRGVEIDTTGMTLELVETLNWKGVEVCGLGGIGPNSRPSVQISKIGRCWSQQDIYFKRELLFHEFGHAFFGRLHDNDTLPNGAVRSIMAQGIHGIFFNETKLEYYIDELFDPTTPIPDWAK